MVILGSCKPKNTQLEIQGQIRQVLICRYTETRSILFYLINYKNDSAVLATTLEKPNWLSIDNYSFGENKGDSYLIPPNKSHIDKYSPTKK